MGRTKAVSTGFCESHRPFLFVDESGDPGDNDGLNANSLYYTELALQITKNKLDIFLSHIIKWRYDKNIIREPKNISEWEIDSYLKPLLELSGSGDLKCSAVYLFKPNYTGPYLKQKSPRRQNPVRFRHFVRRHLLEFHFRNNPLQTNVRCDIYFDMQRISKEARDNFYNVYLPIICRLPYSQLDHICHIESRLCLGIQMAGQLANSVNQVLLGKLKGDKKNMLTFIDRKDITADSYL